MNRTPHDETAEAGFLGSALIDSDRVLGLVVSEYGVSAECFYIPANRIVFETIMSMYSSGAAIDTVTVSSKLSLLGRLQQIGGAQAIETLVDKTPTSAHAGYYAEIIKESYDKRKIISVAREAMSAAEDGMNGIEVAASCITGMDRVINSVMKARSVEEVNKSIEQGWDCSGVVSRFHSLHDMFRYDGMVVLGAYPSVGKTATLCHETVGWCDRGLHVAGASLEMSEEKIRERIASSLCGINMRDVRNGSVEARAEVKRSLAKMVGWKLTLNDNSMTCDSFCAWARAMKARGAQIIWVDYLQLFSASNEEWFMPVEQRTSMWSSKIKSTQKAIGIPIIVLSQLSRPFTRDTSSMPPPPTLSSLRYSGSIEQDADSVLLLYKDPDQDPSYYLQNQTWPEYIDIAKQRNGETGRIKVFFERQTQRFKDELDIVFTKQETETKQKPKITKDFDW